MPNGMLADRTVVISGGSCGIGLAIGVAAAKRGANVVLLAKTDTPHPHLPGTVHTADGDVEIISRPAREATANCHIDAAVLRSVGVEDLSRYGGGEQPITDLFLD